MYRPSYAILFLIVAWSAASQICRIGVVVILIVYIALDYYDFRQRQSLINKTICKDFEGWKPRPGGDNEEENEFWVRTKLTGSDLAVVGRIREMLTQMFYIR